MEISIPPSGVFQFSPPPAVKTVSTDPTPTAQTPAAQTDTALEFPAIAGAGADTTNNTNPKTAEGSETLKAALSFKDTYAVSDSASSSYKDVNGTLITITRDYRTGKVTYSPEPAYVKSQPSTGVSLIA